MFNHNRAETMLHEMARNPEDRDMGGLWGTVALETAVADQIDALEGMVRSPSQDKLLDGLLAELMKPDYLKPTVKLKRKRKKWDALSRAAGHELGSCFDTGEPCRVCMK